MEPSNLENIVTDRDKWREKKISAYLREPVLPCYAGSKVTTVGGVAYEERETSGARRRARALRATTSPFQQRSTGKGNRRTGVFF